uniref:Olfactory receptor 103 n=1 Tax=Aulacocentrum confusum TaxID=2767324 RepID=A0A7G8Z9C2_9HYME|nr:olfactory receptor 103 [Aulacocentrum confusum]
MFLNRERVARLHQMLDPCFLDFLSGSQEKNILDGVTTFRRLSLILTALIGAAASLYIFMPLAFVIYQHLHHVENIKYILVYPAIYPWEISPNGLLYKLHYISEATPNIALMCVTAGVDSLFTLHVFQMIGRLRKMSYCILNAGRNSNYKKAVRQCVSQHETLLECRDILEKVYGPMILWIMVTNAIILCSLMFQLSQVMLFFF